MSSLICPKCKCQAENDELFCSKCGAKLDPASSFCKACGEERKNDEIFCKQCKDKCSAKKRITDNLWWIVAVLLVLLRVFHKQIASIFIILFQCCIIPPATISFRQSMLYSSTRVMQITNRSESETLVMRLDVSNEKKNQASYYVFIVKPSETQEIGILEMNWAFEEGEKYSLKADGYLFPITGTVP